jgi:hypothetical protein
VKLTRNEINAVATAALSGMFPVNALWYKQFFGIPHGRAMALERHRFKPVDIRRIKGALERAHAPKGAGEVQMKCIEEIKTRAIMRVSDASAAEVVKNGTHRYVPKNRWRADKRKHEAVQESNP